MKGVVRKDWIVESEGLSEEVQQKLVSRRRQLWKENGSSNSKCKGTELGNTSCFSPRKSKKLVWL